MKLVKNNSFIQTNILKNYLGKIHKGGIAKTLDDILNIKEYIFLHINGIIEVSKPRTNKRNLSFSKMLLCGYLKLDKNSTKNNSDSGLLIIPSSDFLANNDKYEKSLVVKDLHELIANLKFNSNYSSDGFDDLHSFDFFFNTLSNLAFDKIIELSMYYEVQKLESTIQEFGISLLELFTPYDSCFNNYDEEYIVELKTLLSQLKIEPKSINSVLRVEVKMSENISNKIRKQLTILGVDEIYINGLLESTKTDQGNKGIIKSNINKSNPTRKEPTVKLRNLKIITYALTELLGKYPEYQKNKNLNVSAVADAIIGIYSDNPKYNFVGRVPTKKTISNNHSNIKKEIKILIEQAIHESENKFSQK